MAKIAEAVGLSSIQVELEVTIEAARERVWKALLHEMGAWWRKDFYCAEGSTRFVCEAQVGGRVYEEGPGGAGLLWGTVAMITPPKVLQLNGQLSPPWGGPATSFIRIELEEARDGTRVKLTDHVFGVVDEATQKSLHEGWTLLMAEGLKPYVEKG